MAPHTQTINFRFVPTKYQVLYSNCVGFLWNIYLSYQSFRGSGKGSDEAEGRR